MNRFSKMIAAVLALLTAAQVSAISLDTHNKDAVRLSPQPYFNLQAVEASNTSYKLTSKSGAALSGNNYGIFGIGASSYEISKDITLTQGACNTLWGSTTNRDVHLYVANAESQGKSTSNSSPSTNISGGSDTNFKIAVDGNPVVNVTLTLAGLSTGSAIASALTSTINTALEAAGQGARVDAAFSSSLYVITSRAYGARSSVVITDGTTANVADNLKIGVANSGVEVSGGKGPQLCVSDVAGKQTVGSQALGAAGYASCGSTLPAATPIRQIASADLNCTGPVIGTLKEYNVGPRGYGALPVKKYGSASSATASSALVFAVKGLESGDICNVTVQSLGTGPNYIKFVAVTADTLTATVDTAQSSGSTVINYICY